MAVKISDLSVITTATDDDYYPMVDPGSGQTRRITKADLLKELRLGTDLGIGAVKANKADFSVADQTARDALLSPFQGMIVYRKDIGKFEIYTGSTWIRYSGMELLADVSGSGSSTTLTTGTINAKSFLHVIAIGVTTSTTVDGILRFNADAAANYATRYSFDGGADVAAGSATSILATPATSGAVTTIMDLWIVNTSSREKLVVGEVHGAAIGAANTPVRFEFSGKWANTSSQITRVDWLNTGGLAAGNWATTTRMIVEGM